MTFCSLWSCLLLCKGLAKSTLDWHVYQDAGLSKGTCKAEGTAPEWRQSSGHGGGALQFHCMLASSCPPNARLRRWGRGGDWVGMGCRWHGDGLGDGAGMGRLSPPSLPHLHPICSLHLISTPSPSHLHFYFKGHEIDPLLGRHVTANRTFGLYVQPSPPHLHPISTPSPTPSLPQLYPIPHPSSTPSPTPSPPQLYPISTPSPPSPPMSVLHALLFSLPCIRHAISSERRHPAREQGARAGGCPRRQH